MINYALKGNLSQQSVLINGQIVKDLALNRLKTCQNTASFVNIRASVSPYQNLTICRGNNNTIALNFRDASDLHAECYLKNGTWLLRDRTISNGTFYKLKLKIQIKMKNHLIASH